MSRIRSIHPGLWDRASRSAGFGCHLYVIREGDAGPCKIGISRNAFWRRNDLQVGNHRKLTICAVFATDDRRDAICVEASVLQHFNSYHLGGEWLDVTPDALIGHIFEEFDVGED